MLTGQIIGLVPVAAEHVPRLQEIGRTPQVRARWNDTVDEPKWPFNDDGMTVFTIVEDGEIRGFIQYYQDLDRDYRNAGMDIFVDPAASGRGIGVDAIRTLATYLIDELGHHRLIIDPAADNAPAIKCYAAVGFKPVGVMRQYERSLDGTWHDGLLMDLLAGELVRA